MQPMISAESGKNRRHKPHPEAVDLSPKERAAESVAVPLLTLAAVLGRDEHFMAAVDALRDEPSAVDRLAKRYAPKAGRGRRVIVRMLEAAAAEPNQAFALARLTNLTPATWSDAPLERSDRVRWLREGARHREAAQRIARRGAGLCLEVDCPTRVAGWCFAHEGAWPEAREADERSMRTLLAAAARALGV